MAFSMRITDWFLRWCAAIEQRILSLVLSFFVQLVVLCIRNWIHYVAVPFSELYNATHIASDGRWSNEGVDISQNIRFGSHPSEILDIMTPTLHKGGEAVLFVHGGGFVCVHRGVLLHSVTPLFRSGFSVYCMDYPFAPENRFPVPVISVLRCLRWMKSEHRVSSVRIVADIAGGSLAAMAVAALANPFGDWDEAICKEIRQGDFPSVTGVALLYAVCDAVSWKEAPVGLFGRGQNAVLDYCLRQYKRTPADAVTLCEHVDLGNVQSFPPTLLICGKWDPLQHSHALTLDKLEGIGVEVRSVLCEGFHGFHGMPCPFSFGYWRRSVYPANCELIRWLANGDESRVPPELPIGPIEGESDFRLLFVLAVVHGVVAVLGYSVVAELVLPAVGNFLQ